MIYMPKIETIEESINKIDTFNNYINYEINNNELSIDEENYYVNLIKDVEIIKDLYINNKYNLKEIEKEMYDESVKKTIDICLDHLQKRLCSTPEGLYEMNVLLQDLSQVLNSDMSDKTKIKTIKRMIADKSIKYDVDCFLFESILEIFNDKYSNMIANTNNRGR